MRPQCRIAPLKGSWYLLVMTNFDPSALAVHNGAFLGLEVPVDSAEIVILPVPWDVTTSYRPGTVSGPEAVIEASYQLDLYSPYKNKIWEMKLGTLPVSEEIKERSVEMRSKSARYIEFLEQGGDVTQSKEQMRTLTDINGHCEEMVGWVKQQTAQRLSKNQGVLLLGGDHSTPLGAIQAYAEKYPQLSILHFDAHADLRKAYEGFEHSHASIMNNVLERTTVQKLVQVGIRDVSIDEVSLIEKDKRVKTFYDWTLKDDLYSGKSWNKICEDVVSNLTKEVYISFDIDGLDPKMCPNTGTPVPGGLEFHQAVSLIQSVIKSGRKIVGGDLVEVAPGDEGNEWDGNVGARMLFQIAVGMYQSR